MSGQEDIQELHEDLKELESILKSVVRSNVRKIIADDISTLKTQLDTLEKSKQKETVVQKSPDEKPAVHLYTKKITSYGWDESPKFVKIYVSIPKCDEIKQEQTSCEFTETSFKLSVNNHNGKNHLLQILRLGDKIKPDASSYKLKPDNIIISCRKAKDGETWGCLTDAEKKSKEAKDAKYDSNKDFDSSDPSAGIMNLMKKMYDEGDDDMKRMIKKTWYESQQKQAAGGGGGGIPGL